MRLRYHSQVAERILFIYAKLNPGVKYVQVSDNKQLLIDLIEVRYCEYYKLSLCILQYS